MDRQIASFFTSSGEKEKKLYTKNFTLKIKVSSNFGKCTHWKVYPEKLFILNNWNYSVNSFSANTKTQSIWRVFLGQILSPLFSSPKLAGVRLLFSLQSPFNKQACEEWAGFMQKNKTRSQLPSIFSGLLMGEQERFRGAQGMLTVLIETSCFAHIIQIMKVDSRLPAMLSLLW